MDASQGHNEKFNVAASNLKREEDEAAWDDGLRKIADQKRAVVESA